MPRTIANAAGLLAKRELLRRRLAKIDREIDAIRAQLPPRKLTLADLIDLTKDEDQNP